MVTVLLRGACWCVRRRLIGCVPPHGGFGARGPRPDRRGPGECGARSPASGIVKSIAASAMQSISNPHLATPRFKVRASSLAPEFVSSLIPNFVFAHCDNSRNYVHRRTWIHISAHTRTCGRMFSEQFFFGLTTRRLFPRRRRACRRARFRQGCPAPTHALFAHGSLRLGHRFAAGGLALRCARRP
jgi:hypothetical protein